MLHCDEMRTPVTSRARTRAARKRHGPLRLRPWGEALERRALLASIEGLGILSSSPPRTVIATALSADGSTVVGGESLLPTQEVLPIGFEWTAKAGLQTLGSATDYVLPDAVSNNGSTIVGSYEPGGSGPGVPIRWTASNGVVPLAPNVTGQATGVSADGSTVIGQFSLGSSDVEPYIWTQAAGFEPIPLNDASGISALGTVVAGNNGAGPAYWSQATGTRVLGGPANSKGGSASAISGDGSTVVGEELLASPASGVQMFPFAWPIGGTAVQLSSFQGQATAVSANGSTIVGTYTSPINGASSAFIWTAASGFHDLFTYLEQQYGASFLQGWGSLDSAVGISADGLTIAGNSVAAGDHFEGWIVNLDAPPPPRRTPAITWSNPSTIVYGTPLSAAQLDAIANVPGTFAFSPPAQALLHAGAGQTLSVTFTPNDTIDYTYATATVSINVLRATPTITWANPADIVAGTPLGVNQLDATASATEGGGSVGVPGIFTYTPPAGTFLAAGDGQMLSASFTPLDTTDFTDAAATASINVLPATPPPRLLYATKTVATARPRSSPLGRLVTLTATVKNRSHTGGVPAGTVTFLEGTTMLGSPVSLRRGQAILRISSLPVGHYTILVDYSGNQSFAASSSSVGVTIQPRRSRSRAALLSKRARAVD